MEKFDLLKEIAELKNQLAVIKKGLEVVDILSKPADFNGIESNIYIQVNGLPARELCEHLKVSYDDFEGRLEMCLQDSRRWISEPVSNLLVVDKNTGEYMISRELFLLLLEMNFFSDAFGRNISMILHAYNSSCHYRKPTDGVTFP